ncbi:Homeobox-leucine zipper protein HOX33 [Dendrobium catenatum]|uniref:Homeobox-leucine zipper protein HOX33 n=1 Tax=Dendrobium catenatum TaxID=906689 RepID=A0A2I0XHK0_9ASPA|nr:Homeobox-leucine zipper protein HOX33 [Dendrobium catenatum]
MLLQNVPSALLVQFLRENRFEWADLGVDAYSATSLRASPNYVVPGLRVISDFLGSHIIILLAHTMENEEVLEVLTFTFQFTSMAQQYFLSVVASVQRVAMAISPSGLCNQLGMKHTPGSPKAYTLLLWISRSYRALPISLLHLHVERGRPVSYEQAIAWKILNEDLFLRLMS